MKNYAKKLIELRGDIPRKKVAADLEISYAALNLYELGQRKPSDDIKIKLANYYNTSVEDIFFKD